MPPLVVAVDLGGTQIRAALCDTDGQMLRRAASLTQAHEGPDAVLARIYQAMEQVMRGVAPGEIVVWALAHPAPLNPTTGVVREASNLPGWYDVPLRALVAERFGRPTFLGNDANLAALAEYLYGAAQGVGDMIYLTISTGIGSENRARRSAAAGRGWPGGGSRTHRHRPGRSALWLRPEGPSGGILPPDWGLGVT